MIGGIGWGVSLIIFIASLTITLYLLLRSQSLLGRLAVTCSGLDWKSLRVFCLTSKHRGHQFMASLNSWSTDSLNGPDFNIFITENSFGILVRGIVVEWRLLKVTIRVKSISIFMSPKPSFDLVNRVPTSSIPKGGSWAVAAMRVFRRVTRGVFHVIAFFLSVEIEEFNCLFTSMPRSIPKVDFWIGHELCLRHVYFFPSPSREDRVLGRINWLQLDDIHAKEVFVRSADGFITDRRQIISLPKLSLFQHLAAGVLETRICFGVFKVDLWPSSLLLYTSTFLKKGTSISRPSDNADNAWDDALEAWKNLLFPDRHLFAICSEGIEARFHLPISKVETIRFESIFFTIDSAKAFVYMDTAKTLPLFCVLSPKFRMSAQGAEVVGPEFVSRLQQLFEGSFPVPHGVIQDLLVGFKASLSNCWPCGEILDAIDSLSDETINSWIQRVLDGNPVWGVQVDVDNSDLVGQDYKKISQRLMKMPQSLFSDTFDEASNPFTLRDYRLLPKTILLRLQHLSFDVPFEFPLANLFDHLSYFIKSLKAPAPKEHDSQDIDFFHWTWRLVVVGEHGRFSVADGPFEAKLNRIFSKRKLLQDRFRKLEQAFWSRSDKIENDDDSETFHFTGSLHAFIESSLNPDLLRKSSYLISCYQRLHEVLFNLYHEQMKLADCEHLPPLFSISGRHINFCLRWNPSYLNGKPMSSLLNAIELSEKSFTSEIVADFGMFLGGFLDLSGQDLTVQLRDYALPLVKAHNVCINGLFFIIEEPSYPNGMATSFIPVVGHGSSNLRGVGIDGRVLVKRTILPTKLYHSLGISIFGEQCALASFSLRYESAFQMLDRAFELFSKPPQEPSPHLPFWDKLRLLLRGALTAAHVSCPARVIWIAGKDLHSANESLDLVFPRGFRIGLLSAKIRLRVPEAAIFMNSEQESILRWLHYTTGAAFYKTECSLMGWSPDLIGDIPAIQFPQCQFDLCFEISGLGGKPVIPHNSVRLCVSNRIPRSRRRSLSLPASPMVYVGELSHSADPPKDFTFDEPYDSYKHFRIHSMGMILHVTTPQCQDQARLFWYYYREVEDWIKRNLKDNFSAPVKPGRLFQFATLSRKATPKLSSVLSEFRFSLNYDGFFCARLLQYYDASQFGGVLICSEGRTRIWLNYKRSEQRSPQNTNYGRWFGHFMEVDFSNVRLAVITSDTNAENNLRTAGLPFSYEGVAIFTILTAPRLFWIAVNEGAFKHDSLGKAIQRKCLESRVSELGEEIDRLTVDLRAIDPNEDTNKFAHCRREVSVLIQQQTHFNSFLESPDNVNSSPRRGINNHQYIIQNAHLVWHQDVRDAIFALVDQQFQFFRLTKCLETDIWRTLKDLGLDVVAPIFTATSPVASGIGSRPVFMESPGTFTESILNSHSPFEANPERSDEDVTKVEFVHRDMPEPIQLAESGIHVATQVDFTLVNPQMVLLDTSRSGKVAAAISMVAKNASVNYGTLLECEGGQRVGRRTKISLEQAEVHVAFRSEFEESEWPPHFPPEYLLSRETEESRFHRISTRLRLTILYDVANPEYPWRQATSPVRRLFPAPGDRIVAESSGIEVLTTSEQFAVFYDILVELLVYRDPTQKMRHEQLESIMLATNIFDSEQILARVKQNQENVWRLKQRVTRKLAKALRQSSYHDTVKLYQSYAALKVPWDSLALIVDALRTVRTNQEKLRQRQTRLLLEVLIGKIQWSLLQTNGTDALADLILHRNRVDWLSSEDGSQSLLMEIQTILALNRLPKAFYRTLIAPVSPDQLSQLKTAKEGFRGIGTLNNSLRFYVKMLPPVGGIRIIEHAELNLAPLHLQLTYNIAEELIKFFFPEKKSETKSAKGEALTIDHNGKRLTPQVRPSALAKTFSSPDLRVPPSIRDDKVSIKSDEYVSSTACNPANAALPRSSSYLNLTPYTEPESPGRNTLDAALMMESDEEKGKAEMVIRGLTSSISTTASSFFSHFSHQPIDDHDVELMKSRASDNYSFIYVTVPASQHLISYKGKWDNSITDVENFVLKLPDFEYHSQIWSWLELALQLRRDSVGVVVNNVGALLKDKLRRLGQANKPEIDMEEETEEVSSSVAIGGLSRAVSRLRRSRRPTTEETPEDQDAKARLILGRSYIKPD